MIKRIMFALLLFSLLGTSVMARLSPAMEIIEKRMGENRAVSATGISPTVEDMVVDTLRNVAVFKSFPVYDADGNGKISFEVTDYPSHGSVKITDEGQFVYRPLSDYTGKDSFEYRAIDAGGNISDTGVVQIKVSRPAADIYFDDMKDHWAHNSAIKMASTGLMRGDAAETGINFNPEDDMMRGDFLALSLIMAGYEKDIPLATKTVFADDSMIPQNIKSYVQYAYDKGIISGYDNGDGSINFESQGAVSRAEAALIVSRILNVPKDDTAVPSYKDASGIPAWASSAVAGLSKIGVLGGDELGMFYAEKSLSRAEGAEMICNVASYVEDKEKEEHQTKKSKNLFNLFGLLSLSERK